MKIYIVRKYGGEYEDFDEENVKAFGDRLKAEAFIEQRKKADQICLQVVVESGGIAATAAAKKLEAALPDELVEYYRNSFRSDMMDYCIDELELEQ